jgi:inositol 1,4,5-triphosphate receptor type 1
MKWEEGRGVTSIMNRPYKIFYLLSVKPANGIVITDELREELDQAALATQQAYIAVRAAPGEDASFGLPPALSSNLEDLLAEKVDRAKEREEENKLSPKVSVMKPILRFLQLLCENHNRHMQNLLRDQVNRSTVRQLIFTL